MTDEELDLKAQEWFLLAKSLDWKSYDPFDLLISPYLVNLPALSPFLARLVLQLGKISGAWIRRLLKVDCLTRKQKRFRITLNRRYCSVK